MGTWSAVATRKVCANFLNIGTAIIATIQGMCCCVIIGVDMEGIMKLVIVNICIFCSSLVVLHLQKLNKQTLKIGTRKNIKNILG